MIHVYHLQLLLRDPKIDHLFLNKNHTYIHEKMAMVIAFSKIAFQYNTTTYAVGNLHINLLLDNIEQAVLCNNTQTYLLVFHIL